MTQPLGPGFGTLAGKAAASTVVASVPSVAESMSEVVAGTIVADASLLASGGLAELRLPESSMPLRGGKRTTTDGPFAEAKEVIAGYWLLRTKSQADAIPLTALR